MTFIKTPCKFEQNRPRNVGVDVNGLMLAPNGLKKAWPPGKTPQNRYVISLICMSVISNSLKYKKRRIRKRRIASTRRIRRGKKRRIRRDEQ